MNSPRLENKVTLQFHTNAILKLFSKLLHPQVIFIIQKRLRTFQILQIITNISFMPNTDAIFFIKYNKHICNESRTSYSHKQWKTLSLDT
jgi:hypothetical protein